MIAKITGSPVALAAMIGTGLGWAVVAAALAQGAPAWAIVYLAILSLSMTALFFLSLPPIDEFRS